MPWGPGVDQVWVSTWVGALNRVQKVLGQRELKRKPQREDGAAQGRGRREVPLQPFPPPHPEASLLQSPCGEGWRAGFSQPSPRTALAWDSFPAGLIPLLESLQLTHNPVVTHWTMCLEQSSFQREKNSSGGVS